MVDTGKRKIVLYFSTKIVCKFTWQDGFYSVVKYNKFVDLLRQQFWRAYCVASELTTCNGLKLGKY
jgi:hypothetical protein